MLQVLVKHGANVRLEDEDGMLPIHIAAEAGRVDAFKVLKEHGADIFERTDDQSTWYTFVSIYLRKPNSYTVM